MNEQLQQAIADLFNKFGIVFDEASNWTRETLMPYIQQLIYRMQIYNIVTSSISLIFLVLLFIFCCVFVKKAYLAYKLVSENGKENFYFDVVGCWKTGALAGTIMCVVVIFFCLILSAIFIDSIVSWAIMPDVNFIVYLMEMTTA